jgi:aspartyl-tRNA(Asn)/glutamyl-tRNA(Gln) amidotransferase subunit A
MQLYPAADETIHGIAKEIQHGRLTCSVVLDRCLKQIEEQEATIRAWVLVDWEGARDQALERDAELKAGRYRGPLHGIPIGIKDIYDVKGFGTAAGSELLGHSPAAEDSAVVKRLRDAGAVIVGKTVTTQYASFDPSVTRNPWHPHRTPGGSSSGSAAAVATGMCLAAMGSQTGGSITRPASYCGVAGCKPTYGLVSSKGIFPLAPSMDHPGPIARCVLDLSMILGVIADSPVEYEFPADLPSPRLGLLRGHFEAHADNIVLMAVQEMLDRCAQAGAHVHETKLPKSFDEVIRRHRSVMACEAAAWHEHRLKQVPHDYLPNITRLLMEGLAIPVTEYIRCRQHQELLKQEMLTCFGEVDVLVMPATTSPAPDLSTTGDPAFNSPWSYTGYPVVSFPIAVSADGLPLAIQLVGQPFREQELFSAALWCEKVVRQLHQQPV